MTGARDVRVMRRTEHAWHSAINALDRKHLPLLADAPDGRMDATTDGKTFMYEARHMALEVPRLAAQFERERTGKLRTVHHQCSHDTEGTRIVENYLTCALGVRCSTCPFLAAIDAIPERFVEWERDANGEATRMLTQPVPSEEVDVLKAWTCATHIAMRGGDVQNEGYIMTVDDRMYWNNIYQSLSQGGSHDDTDD